MNITVDISLYPLDADYVPPIKAFIRALNAFDGIEIVTNQLSTQLRGDFDTVTQALNTAMRAGMEQNRKVVFVTRYLNADLDISRPPSLD